MTEVPPPPPQGPGGYPPPPPAAGAPALPGGNFEIWIRRVGAYIIDVIPVALLSGIGGGIAGGTATTADCVGDSFGDPMTGGMSYVSCQPEYTGVGWAAYILFSLAALAFAVWNWGLKQGTTGSSIGKACSASGSSVRPPASRSVSGCRLSARSRTSSTLSSVTSASCCRSLRPSVRRSPTC